MMSINISKLCDNIVCFFPDVDECSLFASALCRHTCRNTLGSYECGCRDGFELMRIFLCIGIIIRTHVHVVHGEGCYELTCIHKRMIGYFFS